MPKLYIVEDDDNIRMLILYALNPDFEVVGFSCGEDLFAALSNDLPDLIILDIMLPGQDGISILKELRANPQTENISIIMLSAKGSEYDRVTGLDTGADDYIVKPFSVLELSSRIKAVLKRGNHKLSDSKINIGPVFLYSQQHLVKVADEEINLTHKEFQLLEYLMKNKGVVMNRDQLMDKIWGFDFQGESRTVDMHIKTLRQKLKAGGDIIKTIRGVGYKASD